MVGGRSTPAPLRVPRALLASLACVLGAVVAHLLGGGAPPSVVVVAVVVAGVAPLSLSLSRRRLSGITVLALTLIAQALLHVTYLLSSPDPGSHGGGVGMLVAHVCAGVVTTAVATMTEDAVWRLLDSIIQRIWTFPRTRCFRMPVPHRLRMVGFDALLPTQRLWRRLPPRRGPPLDGTLSRFSCA